MRRRRPARLRMRRDMEATKAARFLDRESYIDLRGRKHLRGEDMSIQRAAVYSRDNGVCQLHALPNHFRWDEGEVDHILSRGRGGTDDLDNLRWVCRTCHAKKHNREPKFYGGLA